MRILIGTRVGDLHTQIIAAGLSQLGHAPYLWYTADLPLRQTVTIDFNENGLQGWEAGLVGEPHETERMDVVWHRRPHPPHLPDDLPAEQLHPDDRVFTEAQLQLFYRSIWEAIASQAFWINPLTGKRRADSKIMQLKLAPGCGLDIPPTRISSDPADIKDFLARYPKGDVIYKPFKSASWELPGGGRADLPTSVITYEDLPDDDILRLTPGIFQRKIDKAFEVRATFFGATCLAAEIDSQTHAATQIDFRTTDMRGLTLRPYDLPPSIYQACRTLMRSLGIVFGCFDFIVTPDGRHVFLEVNEMGQFLWVEHLCPEITMTDCMCRFLLSSEENLHYKQPSNPLRFAEIYSKALHNRVF